MEKPDLQAFWMLLTSLSGVEDEAECARLVASSLQEIVSCRVCGVALRSDEGDWHVELYRDHSPLTVPNTSALRRDLDGLMEAPSGSSAPKIAADADLPVERLDAFPLQTLRGRYGLILAGSQGEGALTPSVRYRLERIAEQLALAVENLRLTRSLRSRSEALEAEVDERTDALRKSRSRLRTLLRVNNALVTHRDREDLFRALAAHLRNELGLDRASVALYDPAEETATVWALEAGEGVEAADELQPGRTFPVEDSGVEPIVKGGEVVHVEDLEAAEELRSTAERLRDAGIRSYVGVPLRAHGRTLGSLHVGSREPDHYDAGDAEFLQHVADQVALAVENALAFERLEDASHRLRRENEFLRREAMSEAGDPTMVGDSPALEEIRRQVEQVAPTGATVLVTGESGTGKELVAQRIHELSERSDDPMITVNCASIPRDLYESEFFGHAEGAFTGADREREGRFAAADGGTLFLDEIAEIPYDLQAKLLRVLQEGEYERVGENSPRSVDVRVIAATNRDLQRAVDEGSFRKDLFFRLNVFPIEVPPLRERKEDIQPLVRHFVRRLSEELGRRPPEIRERDLEALRSYDWPGNVRELRNLVERALIAAGPEGELELAASLRTSPGSGGASGSPLIPGEDEILTEEEMDELRRRNIEAALEATGGQIYGEGGAAELLGVPPTTLSSRIESMGIRAD